MDRLKARAKALIGKKPKDVAKIEELGTAVVPFEQPDPVQVASASTVDTAKPYILETSKYNFKVVHDPPEPVVDIIFIHGLTGGFEKTWTRTKGKQECFWPEQLLSEDVKNARIAVWGYDADVIKKMPFTVVSTNTLDHHAETLCSDIATLRGKESKQPIIFITHSLGGLVCKTALLHASEAHTAPRAHLKSVSDNTAGIVFMGTPHQGSSKASWGAMLTSFLGYIKQDNPQIVSTLEKEAPHLNTLQRRFTNFLEGRKEAGNAVEITCFFEELPMSIIGTIVPDQSASLDSYEAIGIHENHSDMTKFASDESPGYKRVLGELNRWVANIEVKKTGAAGEKKNADEAESKSGGKVVHHGNVTTGAAALYGKQKFENKGPTTFGGQHTFNHGVGDNKEGES